jgi:hypothetical protein
VMESRQSFDPFTLWRDFYNRAEQAWTESVQRSISTPTFAETMGQTSQTLLNNLEVWRNFAERYVTEVWNLTSERPATSTDQLADRVTGLERRLDDLLSRTEQILTRLDGRTSSGRTTGERATGQRATGQRASGESGTKQESKQE